MKSGVYIIECKINGKFYIGSSKNMYDRLSTHKTLLKNNKHQNKRLQEDYNKYGKDNFEFNILEYTDRYRTLEASIINKYKKSRKIYNVSIPNVLTAKEQDQQQVKYIEVQEPINKCLQQEVDLLRVQIDKLKLEAEYYQKEYNNICNYYDNLIFTYNHGFERTKIIGEIASNMNKNNNNLISRLVDFMTIKRYTRS